SIGGKTGIDLPSGKNQAGAFHQPAAVFADLALLGGLDARQVSSGLAEIVKGAVLADPASVAQIERSLGRIRAGDLGPTLTAVALKAEVKARVVSLDEHERGLRELLNYGHTFGHAYEAAMGYRVTHGEAVAVGLVYATELAVRLGLTATALRERVEAMLVAAGLPIRARVPERTWGFLTKDKKIRAGKVRWILPRRIGRFSEVTDVAERLLRETARYVESAPRPAVA
ncbi:MAG: 3-dehydroquinate synthase, partial [Deltaproteobacteria bacterium]|nr:3-dehydroquinate synthase [Deltaproteobacteria bacterium]